MFRYLIFNLHKYLLPCFKIVTTFTRLTVKSLRGITLKLIIRSPPNNNVNTYTNNTLPYFFREGCRGYSLHPEWVSFSSQRCKLWSASREYPGNSLVSYTYKPSTKDTGTFSTGRKLLSVLMLIIAQHLEP